MYRPLVAPAITLLGLGAACAAERSSSHLECLLAPGLAARLNQMEDLGPIESGLPFLRLRRSGCLGSCPVYSIEVYTDGTVRYEGDAYVLMGGTASKRLTPEGMAELRRAVARAGFLALQRDCCNCFDSTDAPTVSLMLIDGAQAKKIDDYHGCDATPKTVRDLEDEIDRIANVERWIGTAEQRQTCFAEKLCGSEP
jgi:hypothetical protein